MSLSEQIKLEGKRLGFDRIGIASVEPLKKEAAHLREWLDRGFQGTMGYMARNVEKREDITQVLPGAKSVIVGTVNYFTPIAHPADPGVAKISRYAWANDYHDVIPPKLEALLAFIRELNPSVQGKFYVDTGPVMEKAWAAKAGVGWLGKHTNILAEQTGSWFFLAVLIVDIELDADEPALDHCGTCTACIDACPTHAIVEPYVLDATRCISYLTIELKAMNPIPIEFQKDMDRWVFGCDVCQDVCPWNSFQRPTIEAAFVPREGMLNMTFDELAALSEEEFQLRFAGTPVTRTKHEGIKRNALFTRGTS